MGRKRPTNQKPTQKTYEATFRASICICICIFCRNFGRGAAIVIVHYERSVTPAGPVSTPLRIYVTLPLKHVHVEFRLILLVDEDPRVSREAHRSTDPLFHGPTVRAHNPSRRSLPSTECSVNFLPLVTGSKAPRS